MIRRWTRALARTWPVRPFPAPPAAGRRPRTLLRLEAVEDRTLASVAPVDQPDLVPAPSEARVGPSTPPAKPKPDDQSDATQTPTDQQVQDAGPSSVMDGPVLMASAGFNMSLDAPVPSVNRHEAVFSAQFNSGLDPADESAPAPKSTPARTPAGDRDAPAAAGLDATGQTTSSTPATGAPASPAASFTPAPASTPSGTPTATAVTANSTGPRTAADGLTARPRQAGADALGAPVAIARSTRTAGATSSTPSGRPAADLTDGALLQRFVADRDQSAFTALVQRHGRLVLNVCQRVLGDFHAAQDASQATFMVLARKAGMLDRSTPLGGWLYKVAYHLALRSRSVTAKQRLGEREAANEMDAPSNDATTPDLDQRELHQVVREELAGLPEKYRAPLTLCYLDGRSHAEAAREIGLPRGSMAKRVGEGLEFLRERLLHRGLVL